MPRWARSLLAAVPAADKKLVADMVRECMNKRRAANWIAKMSGKVIPTNDKARLVEVVETEFINLHEGNFARYKLRPSEFSDWKRCGFEVDGS